MKSIAYAIMCGFSTFSAVYLMAHAPEYGVSIFVLIVFAAGCAFAVERAKE